MTDWQLADPTARLTDPTAVESPVESSCTSAQEHVNFVAFDPEWLPGDCEVTTVTRRPEQPPGRPSKVSAADIGQTPHSEANPSSIRLEVEGDDRRLRLKQFLYDWAPVAASIAPLWRTPDPTPFDCGEAVGWLGTDYKDNRGACVQRSRTQLEVSVSEGTFTDHELQRFLRELRPVPDSTHPVWQTPFHRLSYWVRYQCRPPAVPHGLWEYSPSRPYDSSDVLSRTAVRSDAPVQPMVVPDSNETFAFDSAVAFPEHDALEIVYRNRANGSDHLWLSAAATESELAPENPPAPADQSAKLRRAVDLRGTEVAFAALTEDRGAWEALWAEDDVQYAVWVGSSNRIDSEDVRRLVDALETP